MLPTLLFYFFFNDTATTEIYTLSLHDALPICRHLARKLSLRRKRSSPNVFEMAATETTTSIMRSEERFSRNAETDLVCRLLLEKKKKKRNNCKHSFSKDLIKYR